MQNALQVALLAIQPAIQIKPATPPKPVARPVKRALAGPARVHRCALNAFTQYQPLRPAVDDATGRHTESRPPPEHEPAFAERYFPPVETLVYRSVK